MLFHLLAGLLMLVRGAQGRSATGAPMLWTGWTVPGKGEFSAAVTICLCGNVA